MKSESPGPKPGAITRTHDSSGQHAGSPETLAEWALKYADRSRGVSRRPRHKSANRGDRRPQRRNHMDGHQRPPSATSDPAPSPLWWHVRPDALIGCRIPKDVVVLDIDPRHDGLRHLGHHRRRSRSTGHTPSRFRPQRRRFSHLVSEPERSPNSRTVTESTCCTTGTDTAFCRHRYTQETGQPYTWVHDPTTPMADLPEWLAERTHTGTRRPGGH